MGRAAPRPLIGLESESQAGGDHRAEAFAAWRRFFEAIAERTPARARVRGPALGGRRPARLRRPPRRLGGRRPDPRRLHGAARAPGPAGGLGRRKAERADALALAALDDDDRAARRTPCSSAPFSPAETQSALLQRAGGNPLYAEEFARMVDRPRARRRRSRAPVPESVQGIVAARLDALPRRREDCCSRTPPCSGRCSGSARWQRIGGVDRTAAEAALHALERKEFVRRERRSSVARRDRVRFRHLLVRDVAYGQIPRAATLREAPGSRRSGSSRSGAPRTTPRCSPTITLTRARARPRGRRRDRSARRRARLRSARSRRPRVCAGGLSGGEAVLHGCARALAATTSRGARPTSCSAMRRSATA